MSRIIIILLGLVALTALALFCINTYTPRIEDDLAVRTQQVLQQQGKEFVQVGVDGRDIYLSGIAPDIETKQQTVEIAKSVFGVRRVVDQIDLHTASPSQEAEKLVPPHQEPSAPMSAAPQSEEVEELEHSPVIESVDETPENQTPPMVVNEPADPEIPYLTEFSYNNGDLSLSGNVPDELAHAWLITKAEANYGKGNIADNTQVSLGAPKDWHTTAEIALQKMATFEQAKVKMVGRVLTLSGSPLELEQFKKLESDLNKGIGKGYTIALDIDLIENPAELVKPPAINGCQKKFDQIIAGKEILFGTNETIINPKSYSLLDELSTVVKECAAFKVEIGGHTDSSGLRAYNQKLSEDRANAVLTYLQKKGVSLTQLTARGYGEEKPRTKSDASDSAINRRIEFKIIEE